MARSWDTHTHAFGPVERFPPSVERGYDPPPVRSQDAIDQGLAAGLDGLVWVHASIYGFDNRVTFAALAEHKDRSRAIVMPPETVDPAELDRWHASGVRGLRLNLLSKGGNGLSTLLPFGSEMKRLGWHVAAFMDCGDAAALDALCGAFEVPVLVEHFGNMGKKRAVEPENWAPMLRWMRAGRLWCKLSAPYHSADDSPDYHSLLPLLRAMAEAGADQLVCGSNWPHIGHPAAPSTSDMRAVLDRLAHSAGLDPQALWAANADRLYA